MKKGAVLIMLTIFFCVAQIQLIYGQKKNSIIEVKYENKIFKMPKKGVKKGKAFRIKVDGINTAVHTVKFGFTDYELISQEPEILKTILPNLSSGGIGVASISATDNDINNLIINSQIIFKVKDNIDTARKRLIKEIDDTVKQKNLCSTSVDDIIKTLGNIKKYPIDNSEKIQLNSDKLLAFIDTQILYILNFYELLDEQCRNNNVVDVKSISQLSFLRPFYDKLKSSRPYIINGVSTILSVDNEGVKHIAKSDPHLPKKDFTTVNIYLLDRFNSSDTISMFETDLYSTNTLKIDFSIGLASNTLVQNDFYLVKNDSVNTGVGTEESIPIDFGVAALLHIDWRVSPSVALGPVVGISVSVIDTKPRYMLGLSTSIGKFRSISLSAGVNFGYVSVLSNQISSNGLNYDQGDITLYESVPTTNQLKSGAFFAVTYNLTRTKQKQ